MIGLKKYHISSLFLKANVHGYRLSHYVRGNLCPVQIHCHEEGEDGDGNLVIDLARGRMGAEGDETRRGSTGVNEGHPDPGSRIILSFFLIFLQL